MKSTTESTRPELLKRRVKRWAAKIGVEPKQIYIQSMKRKWASCSTAGRVYFSADLLRQEAPFQDLVIAHELIHLLVPNHGALFKSLLEAYVPWSGRQTMSRFSCSRFFSASEN